MHIHELIKKGATVKAWDADSAGWVDVDLSRIARIAKEYSCNIHGNEVSVKRGSLKVTIETQLSEATKQIGIIAYGKHRNELHPVNAVITLILAEMDAPAAPAPPTANPNPPRVDMRKYAPAPTADFEQI